MLEYITSLLTIIMKFLYITLGRQKKLKGSSEIDPRTIGKSELPQEYES